MSPSRCFHCDAPLGPAARTVAVDGRAESVCSEDCARVVAEIAGRGLTRFYAFRAEVGGNAVGARSRATSSVRENDEDVARERAPTGSRETPFTLYDRPSVQKTFVADAPGGLRAATLVIDGVRCAACSWLIEEALGAVPGVAALTIDPLTARADLRFDPARIPLSRVLEQIAALGYRPYPFTAEHVEQAVADEQRSALRRLIVAGLGMMQVGSFAAALYLGAFEAMDPAIEEFLRLVSMLVATPVVLYSGAPFFRGALRSLRARRLGMDVPVSLAIGAAYFASVWNSFTGSGEVYFDSCTMFVFLLSAARYLERAGRQRALNMTRVLASHLPHAATRLGSGGPETVGIMELEPGDRVRVGTGAVVPADGLLEGGPARLDESLVTGESVPVTRQVGETLMAGSLNAGQPLELTVTRTGAETVMAQISRLVADAREARPPAVELADRRASLFIAVVLTGACLVGLYWWQADPARAFEAVLAVLVVTCPCALALATPAAYTVAGSALARAGLLLRRAGALTTLARVTHLVLDKTGTLTEHHTGIARVETLGNATADQALELAAVLESYSEHPLARAFPRPAPGGDAAARDVQVVAGQGVEGMIHGQRYRIGRRDFAAALAGENTLVTAEARAAGHNDHGHGTAAGPEAWLGGEGGLLARFSIAETLRPGAAATIAALRELGISVAIASGDRPGPVAAVAERLAITDWQADLRPDGKLALIRRLQAAGAVVAMVGDGINDGPVLAGADVSLAIGTGTALAHHSADAVLMTSQLEPLVAAFRMARRTRRIIRQNLAWSASYNLIALPLAGAGILTPWMAAIGMSLSSLLVTGNALRLGRDDAAVGARLRATEATPGESVARKRAPTREILRATP